MEADLKKATLLDPSIAEITELKRRVLREIDKVLKTLIVDARINPKHILIEHQAPQDHSIYEVVKIKRLGSTLATLVVRADLVHGAVIDISYTRR